MSFTNKIRRRPQGKAWLALAGALVAVVALGGWAVHSSASSDAAALGQAPPEWAANAGSWPAHNYDLSNTRATTNTDINATNVAKLKPRWRFKLPYVLTAPLREMQHPRRCRMSRRLSRAESRNRRIARLSLAAAKRQRGSSVEPSQRRGRVLACGRDRRVGALQSPLGLAAERRSREASLSGRDSTSGGPQR